MDKELLEYAAKAAGITYHSYINDPIMGTGINIGDVDVPLWNPLINDGDALRLAVDLELEICRPSFKCGFVFVWLDHKGDFLEEKEGKDKYAATRRAIVRAAAEIGKAMS